MKEESCYFIGKKTTKKLLLTWGYGGDVASAPGKSKFFLLLFCSQKRSASK
jgi:hypothetical protein